MKTIYKYPIKPQTRQLLELPKGARVLSVKEQRGGINIYAMVENEVEEIELVPVLLYGTGHCVHEELEEVRFLGTVSMHGGDLVLHAFTEQL